MLTAVLTLAPLLSNSNLFHTFLITELQTRGQSSEVAKTLNLSTLDSVSKNDILIRQ